MAANLILLTITVALIAVTQSAAEVCCGTNKDLGCYGPMGDFFDPLNRPFTSVPLCDIANSINLRLNTRKDLDDSLKTQILSPYNSATIRESNFNPKQKTKILIHGFIDKFNKEPWKANVRALLKDGDHNVIRVDWYTGNRAPYMQACSNLRLVGAYVAKFIDHIVRQYGVKPEDVHIIGHSLGAHGAGYAGMLLRTQYNTTLGRITGLDPAGPYFVNMPTTVRLDPTDAAIVDTIVTNGDTLLAFGSSQAFGDLNFYPNGGLNQPGCSKALLSTSQSQIIQALRMRSRRSLTGPEEPSVGTSSDVSTAAVNVSTATEQPALASDPANYAVIYDAAGNPIGQARSAAPVQVAVADVQSLSSDSANLATTYNAPGSPVGAAAEVMTVRKVAPPQDFLGVSLLPKNPFDILAELVAGYQDTVVGAFVSTVTPAVDAFGCSHNRAVTLYAETISNSTCQFKAYQCSSRDLFLAGEERCSTCSDASPCSPMGYHVDLSLVDKHERKNFYTVTTSAAPYCGTLTIEFTLQQEAGARSLLSNLKKDQPLSGQVYVKLYGERGVTEALPLSNGPINLIPGKTYSFSPEIPKNVGQLKSLVIRWEVRKALSVGGIISASKNLLSLTKDSINLKGDILATDSNGLVSVFNPAKSKIESGAEVAARLTKTYEQ